jgi:hypothetical protein
MQIDGKNPVDAHYSQHVSHHFGADGYPSRTRTAILAGVTEVGDYRSDAGCRGAAEGVCHYHQFHQVIVGWRARRLNQEYVLTTNVFVDFGADLTIGKLAYRGVTEGDMQLTYNTPSQIGVSVPRKDHHLGHAQYLSAEGNLDE